jgi:hypothetical protein
MADCPVTYYAVPVMCLVLRNVFTNLFNANLKASLHKGDIYMQATDELKYADSLIAYLIKYIWE